MVENMLIQPKVQITVKSAKKEKNMDKLRYQIFD